MPNQSAKQKAARDRALDEWFAKRRQHVDVIEQLKEGGRAFFDDAVADEARRQMDERFGPRADGTVPQNG